MQTNLYLHFLYAVLAVQETIFLPESFIATAINSVSNPTNETSCPFSQISKLCPSTWFHLALDSVVQFVSSEAQTSTIFQEKVGLPPVKQTLKSCIC